MPFDPKWFSHKINGPGVRYEIGYCIQNGWIVWVNGPYPCGDWTDLAIFRHCLQQLLDVGERCICDGGYRDSSGATLTPTGHHTCADRQRSTVRARHETGNERFKNWGILTQQHRHPLEKHGLIVNSVATVTQLMLTNGENFFEVEHDLEF